MAVIRRISFNQLLNLDKDLTENDYAKRVKATSCTHLEIPNSYGTGRIVTTPLVGGAGLVVMESCFNEDVEIYAEQIVQEGLSFSICLQGSLTNRCQGRADVSIKQHETLFARYTDKQPQMSSYFKAKEQNCFITVCLSSDWLESATENLQSDILTNPFWLGIYNSGLISQLMLLVAHEIVNATRQTDLQHYYVSAKVLELWSHQIILLRRLSLSKVQRNLTLKAQDIAQIHQAAEILLNEMIDPPSLLKLAHRVGMNDNKLKKGFKQVYGETAFGFLQQHRLRKAKFLISEQEYSVMRAATAVGFKSVSHFSKVFKQTFGILPRQLLSSAIN